MVRPGARALHFATVNLLVAFCPLGSVRGLTPPAIQHEVSWGPARGGDEPAQRGRDTGQGPGLSPPPGTTDVRPGGAAILTDRPAWAAHPATGPVPAGPSGLHAANGGDNSRTCGSFGISSS